MAAACYGLEQFDVYLRGRKFTLYTDHRPLEQLSKIHSRTLNRLQQHMLTYNFRICYKPGKENVVPDFLSRNPIAAIGINLDHLIELQNNDRVINLLKTDLTNQYKANYRPSHPSFNLLKQNLKLKNDIYSIQDAKNGPFLHQNQLEKI